MIFDTHKLQKATNEMVFHYNFLLTLVRQMELQS